jgi:hypothetical protein
MNDTGFRKALMRLCERHPELRKKLAVELARSNRPVQKRARHDEENYMVVRSLMKISDRAPAILEMIGADADELEDWQEFKINLAADYIDSVFDSLTYRLQEEDL